MKIVHLQNAHTSCIATGAAIGDGSAHYLAGAGPGVTVKAIWASSVSNNQGVLLPELYSTSQTLQMLPGSKYHGNKLPDTTYHHFTVTSTDENIILLIDPKLCAADEKESIAARLAQMPDFYHRFYLWLKKNIAIPTQKAWTQTIYEEAMRQEAIKQLVSFGDCIGGWQMKPEHSWNAMIAGMVRDKQLIIS